MNFTVEELELIKEVLTDSLSVDGLLENKDDVIRLLDRIDDECDLD